VLKLLKTHLFSSAVKVHRLVVLVTFGIQYIYVHCKRSTRNVLWWWRWLEPWCHGTVIGSWKLRESVAYGDGVGVSTEAAHDAGGAIGQESERCKSSMYIECK